MGNQQTVMSHVPKKRELKKKVWPVVNDTETACMSKPKNSIMDWVIWISPLPSAEGASLFKWE